MTAASAFDAQFAFALDESSTESQAYLTEQLLTYIGNKRSLLRFIGSGIDRAKELLGKDEVVFLDLFAGSGIVSRFAKRFSRHIIANDLEKYSMLVNKCFLTNSDAVDWPRLRIVASELSARIASDHEPGFITELYSPRDERAISVSDRVFYTRENAQFLDSACRALQDIADPWRCLLTGPILSAASVHANTSGVFKGFYKDRNGVGCFGGAAGDALKRIREPIKLRLPQLSAFARSFEVHQADANDLVRSVDHVDVAYFDPPYNQHPYGSNYFMLNLIVDYKRPNEISRVSGIPVDWTRSNYNRRRHSGTALFDAVATCPADVVLISYSSEGFVSYEDFTRSLLEVGNLEVLDTEYNTFRGCRNLRARDTKVTEFLFLVDKR